MKIVGIAATLKRTEQPVHGFSWLPEPETPVVGVQWHPLVWNGECTCAANEETYGVHLAGEDDRG